MKNAWILMNAVWAHTTAILTPTVQTPTAHLLVNVMLVTMAMDVTVSQNVRTVVTMPSAL